MKQLFLLSFIVLTASFSFAQDTSKYSLALNIGGFHKTPTRQSNLANWKQFHFATHLGITSRLRFKPKQSLRVSLDYKNNRERAGDSQYGGLEKYNEFQMGVGYEFIIRKGKIEPYVGFDIIGVYSRTLDHSWYNENNTYRTTTRLGYGALGLVGLRFNASDKLMIGLETSARYLWNSSRLSTESDQYILYIDTISHYNFLEFNPVSAITVKYSI